MAKINWKYVSPLKDGTEVEVLELKYRFMLPDDLKECLAENNAGTPSLSTFDLVRTRKWSLVGCSPLMRVIPILFMIM